MKKAVLPSPERFDKAVAELLEICGIAWSKGLMSGWSGNASIRLEPEIILITAAGSAKGRLSAANLLLVDLAGDALAGQGRPSSETAMHLAVYRARPDCAAILHTHPPNLQALEIRKVRASSDGLGFDEKLYEAKMWGPHLAFVNMYPPGSKDLAEAAGAAFPSTRLPAAVWLAHHGLCAAAPSLLEALCLTEELEHLAKVELLAG